MEDRLFTPAVVTLVFLSFAMGTSEFIVMGILPDIAGGLGVEYSMVGGLVSVFALSYALLTPVITGFAGRFGRFRVLMVLAVLFLVSDVATLVSWDYWSLALSRVVTAASSGALLSVGMTFVMDLVTPRHRASAVSWIFAGFSISSVFGVPLGTAMSHALGWRSVFVLILVMAVVAILVALRTLPRLGVPEANPGSKGGAGRMLRDPRVLLGACVTVFGAMGMYTMYTYITPILEVEIGFPEGLVSLGLMAMGASMLVSNLISGRVAGHGGMRAVRLGLVLEAVLLFLLPTAVANAFSGMADLILIGLVMYVFNASVQVHLLEISGRDYPESIALASSLNPTSFNIGITVGSLVGGMIYDTVGINSLGYAGGAFVLVGAVMATLVCLVCRSEGRGTSVT